MTSGKKINKLTKEDLTKEERQGLKEKLVALEKALLASFIKTDQGISIRDVPLPQVAVSRKVTSDLSNLSLAIQQTIDLCVDASISAYINKLDDMFEDAFNTSFVKAIKKIGSKIASYQQSNATSNFGYIQQIYNTMNGSTGIYTSDCTGIGYTQNLANGRTARDTGQTVPYAGQTMPTIPSQTVPYLGQIMLPVAGVTASLTTGQAGPWAGQTGYLVAQTALSIAGQSGTLELSPGFHVMTCSTDFNCYSSPVNTISHAIPYTHAICAESCYEPVQSHQVNGLAQDMHHGQKEIYSQNPVVPTHFRSLDQKDNQLRPEVSKTDLRFYDLTSIKQKYDESVID